jgi:hypothetical protein
MSNGIKAILEMAYATSDISWYQRNEAQFVILTNDNHQLQQSIFFGIKIL